MASGRSTPKGGMAPKPIRGNPGERMTLIESRLVQIENRIRNIEDKLVTAIKVSRDRQGRQYVIVKK